MQNHEDQSLPLRRASRKKLPFARTALLLTSVASGAMLGLAMSNLVSGSGWDTTLKAILLAISGTTVAYAVNHLAMKRGAPLAVVGYEWAGVVSVLSIGIVGGGLFAGTYAGLTFKDVEQLSIEAHGEALSAYAADRSAAASGAARIVPAINAIASDLQQKRDCEIQNSCISGFSGKGNGNGPVARLFTEKLGKAAALAQQVENGDGAREQAIGRLNALHGDYQTIASNDTLSMQEKRRTLRGIDLKIRQAASDLDEAVPVALLKAYGDELKDGAELAGRPDITRKVSEILRQHGRSLTELTDTIPERGETAPAFPKATGVSDTFAYILHFLPIAAITAVVELVLPLCLWLYTLFALSWSVGRISPPQPSPDDPEDEFYAKLLPAPEAPRTEIITPNTAPEEPGRARRVSGRRKASLNGSGNLHPENSN